MKPPEGKKHRKRFSGTIEEDDDTAKVGVEITDYGFKYHKRRDGSLYPKPTTITVTESTRRIYSIFREAGGYNNYDELFLDIALPIVRTKSLPVSYQRKNKPLVWLPPQPLILSDDIIQRLEPIVTQAKMDRGFRTIARSKAIFKRRYKRRKTST